MPTRVYIGPCAEIITVLDGVEMTVARGDVVDVSDETAEQLDAQPDNWAEPKSNGKPNGKKKGGES